MAPRRSPGLLAFIALFAIALGACGSHDNPGTDGGTDGDALADAGPDAVSPLDAARDGGGATDARADTTATDPDRVPPADTGVSPDTGAPTDSGTGATDAGPTDAGPGASCPAAAFGARLGKSHLMIGGAMEDTTFAAQPFDVGYRYLAGPAPASPCASCASGCVVDGQDCSNSAGGCGWWGCWQWDQQPPGQYVTDHIANLRARGALPMISYYRWLTESGAAEGGPEVDALANGTRLQNYLRDWRFLMLVIARSAPEPVLVHIEPDLWGYVEQKNPDPTRVPVAVSATGNAECAGAGDHAAGLAHCMVAIARAVAPNALLAFHASAWGAGADALINTDPGFDLSAHADQTAAFLRALGATQGDLIVVEMSDRDAGFNHRWWDASDATLPNFTQALAWVSRVGQQLGLAPLWWQVPYGDPAENNTCNHYQDNRVDYVFDHPDRFAAAGSLGVAFGAGDGCGTTAESDNGHFLSRAAGYYSASPPCLCGSPSCP